MQPKIIIIDPKFFIIEHYPDINKSQIKEITKLAGIQKEVSSHVARHTFATIALTSGVPLVSIQHVLGHSDIRMTQHYSRLVDKKLTDDMEAFKDLMNHQTNTNPYPVILRVV